MSYSFTGINIAPGTETLTISTFYNEADGGPPDLAQRFTDSMRDYFQQNTNLSVVDEDGDLQFEGAVSGFRLSPVSPQAANREQANIAAQTRLTISVNVVYSNTDDPDSDFTRSFSFYSDFDNDTPLESVEDDLIEEIYETIILNIFNASVANW